MFGAKHLAVGVVVEDAAKLKHWCRRHREVLRAQLDLLEGKLASPFDGAGDVMIFTNNLEALQTVRDWIAELDSILDSTNADRT